MTVEHESKMDVVAIVAAFVVLLIFFYGEPDIQSAIISRISGTPLSLVCEQE